MFDWKWLDVAVGLTLIYLMASLLATAILEAIEAGLRTRAKYLWQAIGELVGDRSESSGSWFGLKQRENALDARPRSVSLADVYRHPIINALYHGDYDQAKGRLVWRSLPAYITREAFATTLIDLVSKNHGAPGLSAIEALRRGTEHLTNSQVKDALTALLRLAGDDIGVVQARLADWYDSVMDRVAGWYKRHAQLLLFGIGLALAAGAPFDTLAIVDDLANNEPRRQAYLAAAEQFAARGSAQNISAAEVANYVNDPKFLPTAAPRTGLWWQILGFVITAFAVSLGAPFWFDLLNKFMVVRSTVKPKEKSGDEGSEDRAVDTARRKPAVFMK